MKEENGLYLISKYRSALMGFSALCILYFHLWVRIFEGVPKMAGLENIFKGTSFFGVDIFFLLSGLGLTFSAKGKTLIQFYYKRIRKIFLPFLIVGLLHVIFDGWSITTFFSNISGASFYKDSICAFLWFIPAIVTLYLFFPLYYHFFLRSRNPVIFTLGAVEIWLIVTMIFRDAERQDIFGFTNRIPVFLTGILIGWLIQNRKLHFDRAAYLLFALTFILGIYLNYLSTFENIYMLVPTSNCCIPACLMAISAAILLAKIMEWMLENKGTKTAGKVLHKILVFYGSISLELYCVQEWIGFLFEKYCEERFPPLIVNLLVMVLITALGFLLHCVTIGVWKTLQFADRRTKKTLTNLKR